MDKLSVSFSKDAEIFCFERQGLKEKIKTDILENRNIISAKYKHIDVEYKKTHYDVELLIDKYKFEDYILGCFCTRKNYFRISIEIISSTPRERVYK